MYIIVGSGGFLGVAFAKVFRSESVEFLTSSHSGQPDFRIDLTQPPGDFASQLPNEITHGIICSAISAIDTCRRNYEASFKFNVTHTIELIKQLQNKGITPVFCSSDMVFIGDRGNYREADERLPLTAYGEMKMAVENYLLGGNRPYLIVRLSKLFSHAKEDTSFVQDIQRKLISNETISAASDQFICMTDVNETASAINLLMQRKHTGVYHIAGPEKLTRYSLTHRIAMPMNALHLVEECSIDDIDFDEPRPKNNTLNTDKIKQELNFEFSKF